jgi:hypothetical protein
METKTMPELTRSATSSDGLVYESLLIPTELIWISADSGLVIQDVKIEYMKQSIANRLQTSKWGIQSSISFLNNEIISLWYVLMDRKINSP